MKSSEASTVKTFWDKQSCSTTYGDDVITPVKTVRHQKIETNGIELTSRATMNDFAKIIQKPFIELHCTTRAKWKYHFWLMFKCINQSVKIYLGVMRVLGCPKTIKNWVSIGLCQQARKMNPKNLEDNFMQKVREYANPISKGQIKSVQALIRFAKTINMQVVWEFKRIRGYGVR